jgi:hypothetical protein
MDEIIGSDVMGRYLETNRSAENYHSWLMSFATPFLGKTNLEIGSGLGDYINFWAKSNESLRFVASDGDVNYVNSLKSRFQSYNNVSVVELFLGGDKGIPKADCIIAYNVLEHMKDDLNVMASLITNLTAGGHICIFVPAFQMNFSRHDRAIGHYRRYKKKQLVEMFTSLDLKVVEAKYVNSLGMLAWFISVKLFNVVPTGNGFSFWDRHITPRIVKFEKNRSMRFGNSVWIVGMKSNVE